MVPPNTHEREFTMGFLGSVGRALGGVIKQVAPQILKAVAPAASKLLGGIAKDVFTKGAGFIGNALKALPLPGPLKALGEKLLGKGLEKLTQFAQGGIDKLISKLSDMVMKRLAPGTGTSVAPTPMTSTDRQTAIQNNNPAAPSAPATGSNAAPATGSNAAPATGSPTGGSGVSGSGLNNPSTPAGASGTPDSMPKFEGDPTSISAQNAHNEKMFKYQQAMSIMQQFWQQMSTIQKSNDDTKKAIAQNFR